MVRREISGGDMSSASRWAKLSEYNDIRCPFDIPKLPFKLRGSN
jgi:hypothetical protein